MRRVLLSCVLVCLMFLGMVSPVHAVTYCDLCGSTFLCHEVLCPLTYYVCSHTSVTEAQSEYYLVGNGDDYHTKVTEVKQTCNFCNSVILDSQTKVIEPHSHYNGECLICGVACKPWHKVYNTTYIRAMKKGNLFISWNSALYQRQYISAGCYQDVFYCNITDIDIPDGKDFVKKGNYLYQNNKIVSASPDILKIADERISQLADILLKANVLYNDGVINRLRRDIIIEEAVNKADDYFKVKKAEKELKDVNEVFHKVGDKSNDILRLQWKLNLLGYDVSISGIFDSETFAALIDFQIKGCYAVTGYYDLDTDSLLNHNLGW